MLTSSKDYVLALRRGEFLQFLDWPSFIVTTYSKQNHLGVSADELVDLIIFDWLTNGYCEEDLIQFSKLYSVYVLASKPLSGALEYAFMMLFSALVNCMVHASRAPPIRHKDPYSKDEVVSFMREQSSLWDKLEYDKALKEQQNLFVILAAKVPAKITDSTLQGMLPVLQIRSRVDAYLVRLESAAMPANQLKDARIGVLKRLKAYVNDQVFLTDEVKKEIAIYADKILDLAPEEFERGLINEISPPSLAAIAWRFFSTSSINLLHLVQGHSSTSAEPNKQPKV
jgi:hypothetical protein